jgi:hypothetical protein
LTSSDGRRMVERDEEVVPVQAQVGDQLVVEGKHVGDPRREGEVVEVRGDDGGPPYLIRWSDGHEGLTWPGPDAHVHPKG